MYDYRSVGGIGIQDVGRNSGMGIVKRPRGNVRVEHDILVRGKIRNRPIIINDYGIRNRIYSEVDGCGLCSAVNICDGIGKGIGAIKIGVGRIAKGPVILYDYRPLVASVFRT